MQVQPEDFILAVVEFLDENKPKARYLREPFSRKPDFTVTSINRNFSKFLSTAMEPQ